MFKKNKSLITALGFLMFIIGGSALVLSLVGVKFAFLTWIDLGGPLLGFILRIVMMIGGIVLAVLAQSNWEEES